MNASPHQYDIIRRPIVSEKSVLASNSNAIVFEVAKGANKAEIKEAIESLFSVKVHSVNVLNYKGKNVRFRGIPGKQKSIKKAYVRLVEGYTIDVTRDL